ncbi:MAG: pyrroline-5-carboxylate reductase [Acidaminococcaceae bacterium]|jgi:pyrroline-5-carboxylate reductase|nr:pyrroline-5-carboxylate reductase [Acidaminococcaceae bacterium]
MEKITKLNGRLAFVGGGNMAEAIIKGILAAGLIAPGKISVGGHRGDRCAYLHKTYGINATVNNNEAVKDASMIVLAIKPQKVAEALDETLVATMPNKATVVSIMGSVDLKKLWEIFPVNPLVRAMPNTPLAVGAGMTALAPDNKVSEAMLAEVKAMFGSCGEVEVVSESAMEAITAVSGCGPGYAFVLIDALADAGVNAGLPRKLAIKLAAQTFAGSGKMVIETGKHPAELRDMVTSPGGTTIAALHALESKGVRGAMYDAVAAVLARSEALKGKK